MKKTVSIVGAGFSGLITAWYLVKRGFTVEIHDSAGGLGPGLIHTIDTEFGLVETAANGFMCNALLEELAAELKLTHTLCAAEKSAKRRYIFRVGRRQWPLGISSTFKLLLFILRYLIMRKRVVPKAHETVGQWARRCLNNEIAEYMIRPALQGIYGGQSLELSATLALQSLFRKTRAYGELRGTVSFAGGMETLLSQLRKELKVKGCQFIPTNISTTKDLAAKGPVVVATSAASAARILQDVPSLGFAISLIKMQSMITSTLFFAKLPKIKSGFGCLFAADQGLQNLGVLFNSWIFPGRVKSKALHSETWIASPLGLGIDIATSSDALIEEKILQDRSKVTGDTEQPLRSYITRWPAALPVYSVELEVVLESLVMPHNLFLVGNYLGKIGLSGILEIANETAIKIEDQHKGSFA